MLFMTFTMKSPLGDEVMAKQASNVPPSVVLDPPTILTERK